MKEFVLNFYSYEYSGNLSIADNEDDNGYEDIMIKKPTVKRQKLNPKFKKQKQKVSRATLICK